MSIGYIHLFVICLFFVTLICDLHLILLFNFYT